MRTEDQSAYRDRVRQVQTRPPALPVAPLAGVPLAALPVSEPTPQATASGGPGPTASADSEKAARR